MKNELLFLFIVSIISLRCNSPKNEHLEVRLDTLTTIKNQSHPNYILTAQQTGFDYEINSNDTLSIFGLELELTNRYDTLPALYLMTCSWGSEGAVTNPPNFLIGTPCDANFWMPVEFRTNEILELKTSVMLEKDIDLNEYEIQLGLVLVDTTEINWEELTSKPSQDLIRKKQKEEKDVVWSNVILLKKLDTKIKHGGKWEMVKKQLTRVTVAQLEK